MHLDKGLTVCWELFSARGPGTQRLYWTFAHLRRFGGCSLAGYLETCSLPPLHPQHIVQDVSYSLPPMSLQHKIVVQPSTPPSPSFLAQVLPSAAPGIFLYCFHPSLHWFLLRLLKKKLNIHYTPANGRPCTGHHTCIPSIINIHNSLLFSHFTGRNSQLVLLQLLIWSSCFNQFLFFSLIEV